MSFLRNITAGLRSLFRKEQVDRELDEELGAYLEMEAAEKMKEGMSRKDALRAVRLERGSLDVSKEVVRSGGWEFFVETCWQDIRYGLRAIRRSPGFSILAVLALALGIAVNTTIFTALDATAFRPLPVRDPDHIVRVVRWIRQGYGGTLFSFPEYVYYRDHNDVFSGLAADSCCYNVVYGGQPARSAPTTPKFALLSARLVSENYFEVLGINAVLGRTFLPDEGHAEKSNSVAVLSYQFWRQRFDSDPHILGKSLTLNATPFTVLGIAPRDFIGTGDPPAAPDVWVPLAMQRYVVSGSNWMNDANAYNVRIVGHLKPEVALTKTQAALTVLAHRLR
jgi:MacB-like periplasmic core domain